MPKSHSTSGDVFAPAAFSTLDAGIGGVFPLVPGTKTPYAGSRSHLDATDDPVIVQQWASAWPSSNCGIRPAWLSHLAIIVLDEDTPGALADFLAARGLPPAPPTRTVATRRGSHRYYQLARQIDLRQDLRPAADVDLKTGRNGWVMAPGSVVDGFRYELVDDLPIEWIPAAWLPHLTRTRRPVVRPAAGVPDGPVPGRRLVSLLRVKRVGDGRRAFLRYALGEAWRNYGGNPRLIAELVAAGVAVGLDPGDCHELADYMFNEYGQEAPQ